MTRWRRRTLSMSAAGGATMVLLLASGTPADAQPATTVSYPAWSSATRYVGAAFDTCTAPPLASLQAWGASPYRAAGVYLGGVNRTCSQPELTRAWTAQAVALGWSLLPVYKGLQPPCGGKTEDIPGECQRGDGRGSGQGAGHAARQCLLQRHREHRPHALPDRRLSTCPAGRGTQRLGYISASTRTLAPGPRTCPGSTRRPPTPAPTPSGSPATTGIRP